MNIVNRFGAEDGNRRFADWLATNHRTLVGWIGALSPKVPFFKGN